MLLIRYTKSVHIRYSLVENLLLTCKKISTDLLESILCKMWPSPSTEKITGKEEVVFRQLVLHCLLRYWRIINGRQIQRFPPLQLRQNPTFFSFMNRCVTFHNTTTLVSKIILCGIGHLKSFEQCFSLCAFYEFC